VMMRANGPARKRRGEASHRWDWIWFLFPSMWWERYPTWLQRIGPPIYVAFLILFALGLVIAVVIGLVALTSPSRLNH
jgi:hypothetical protein